MLLSGSTAYGNNWVGAAMAPSVLTSLGVVAAAGVAVALQAQVNAALGRVLGGTVAAAAISFGIGFCVLLALALLLGQATALTRVIGVDRVLLSGGALGGFYVWAILWGVPHLGAVSAFAVLILGQMAMALVLDTFGLFGLPVTAISWQRLLAVLLVAAGVALSRA